MRVLVIGGTAFIGPRVVAHLSRLGHEVAVFHRGRTEVGLPPQVRHIHCPSGVMGHREHFREFAGEFARFAPDAVLDMIPATREDATTLMTLFRGLVRRVVAISSQDVYKAYGSLIGTDPGPVHSTPLSENAPLRERLFPYRSATARAPDDPRRWMDDYDKILVERAVLSDPGLPGTILRLPMVYGPQDRQHRMFEYLRRMDDGRPAILLEEGLAGWRWTRGYVENVAAAVALAVTDPRAAGRIYNVGESHALTLLDWVREIARAAGWTGRVISVPSHLLPSDMQSGMDTAHDLVTDTTRIRRELGFEESVSREEAIRRTVIWERDHPPEGVGDEPPDYSAEDAVLSRLSLREG